MSASEEKKEDTAAAQGEKGNEKSDNEEQQPQQQEKQQQPQQQEKQEEEKEEPGEEQDPIKRFESLVQKYERMKNLEMFKYFHSPGFTKKHPSDVNTIRYVLDGKKVKVSCICGASLDLTDYSKLDKA